MTKKYARLVIILLVFISQETIGQEYFTSGYIVNKEGDTIQGSIDYRNNSLNRIRFKDLKNGTINSYTPESIIAFKVDNDIYKSANIETNTSSAPVFLKTIVEGEKSLFSYEQLNERIEFYIKNNEEYILLVFNKEAYTLKKNEKFKGQLTFYLNDCPSINSHTERASYNAASLGNVFEKYYECTGNTVDYKKDTKIKIEKGVIAGVSITSLKFNDNDTSPYLNSKFKTSTDFTGGVFFDISLSQKEKKWSLYNEILYYSYKTSNEYEDIENENIYTTTNTKISHSFIKMNNLARYNFPVGKNLSMHFNAGLTNGFVITEENYKRVERNVYSVQTISTGPALSFPRNHEFGYMLGLGLKNNRLTYQVRYENTSGVSGDSAVSSMSKFYLLIGLRI